MKKIFLIAVLAGGFAFTAKAQTPAAPAAQPQVTPSVDKNAPVMKFDTDTMNFGTITQGTIVERDYKFKNVGKEPLVITSATGSCHCTVPSFPQEPIQPGKTGVIHVRFDSNGKMGYQDKTATLQSNNRDGAVIIHLRGTVTVPPAAPAQTPAQAPNPAPAAPKGN